jgi:anti-sigma regulatory factor (Ser/Thr protein kinase)
MVGDLRSTESILSSYRAVPEAVPTARNVVASLAARYGAGCDDLERIRLIVSEAVTNVVVHAYDEESAGNVHITAAVIEGELTVVVSDDGCGLGCAGISPGLGLGLGLIANGCDSLSIVARPYGGTQLEMRLALCDGEPPTRVARAGRRTSGDVLSFEGR